MKKKNKRIKKYKPKVSTAKVLDTFWFSHDSFDTIDRLIRRIEDIGDLTYLLGEGYIYNNERGEQINVVQELQDWVSDWKILLNFDQNYISVLNPINKLILCLTFRMVIADNLLEDVKNSIAQQKILYKKYASTEEGRQQIREVVKHQETRIAIRKILVPTGLIS